MRYSALTCCIILQKIIKKFHMVTEIWPEMKSKYGSGKIFKKKNKQTKNEDKHSMKHTGLSCCIILQSIIKIFQMITEILSRNEVKIWTRGHNQRMKISRIVVLAYDTSH